MKCHKNTRDQQGFSLLEVIIAILLMTIGVLALVAALSMAMMREREAEQRNTARQISSSALESIFAARDLRTDVSLGSWDQIDNKVSATPNGVFLPDWTPVRQDPGTDGINGTSDDACAGTGPCVVTGYTNSSPIINGFERRITISPIMEENITAVRKKRIDISVRYRVGQSQRQENISTILADLPFSK